MELIFMVWLNEVEKPKQRIIEEIKLIPHKNGIILNTTDYSCWGWVSDKLVQDLIVALETYTLEGKGKQLIVVPMKKEKRGYIVRPDISPKDEQIIIPWYKNGSNVFQINEPEYSEDLDYNPFVL